MFWLIGGGLFIGLAGLLFKKKPETALTTQAVDIPVRPRRRNFGRVRVNGDKVFERRSILTGDGILYMAFVLNSGEIDAIEEHWIQDQIVRLDPISSGAGNFGITAVTFPATVDPDKPPAVAVVITAYDAGYVLPVITADYIVNGSPVTLDAISVGIVGGVIVKVVFPYTVQGEKPLATGVTFTIGGAGTGAALDARPNSAGLWDGGFSPSGIQITSGGTGYTDTVGGYGAYLRPRPNGVGRWDGGASPRNVAIDSYGVDFVAPTVVATWMVGSSVETLTATSVTIGGGMFAVGVGNVIYPAIWYDNGRVTISEHLGLASQTADPLLASGFPGTWTAQHRLDGVAYVALRLLGVALEDFAKVYKFGIPTYWATIRAAKLWDPRVSGQDPDDPTTWAWSDNAALVIMDYLWHPDGMRLPRAMIETALADWIIVANYCDDQVPLLNCLTEPRYRLWGGYDFDEEPKSVLGRMLACIDGRVRLREDGAIVLDVGQFDCPTSCETFASADIIRVEGFRRGASKDELRNEIRAKYLSPGHNFQEQEADPLRNDTSVLVDGLQSATIDLTYCPSHRQARQMMKVASYRLNPVWQGTIVTNAKGLRLLGERYARFQIAALGIDEVFFIKRADIDLLVGRCTFQVISFPAEAYCWTTCEEGVSPEHERPGDHGICVPVGACAVTIRAIGGGGGGSEGNGGGGGAYVELTIAIDPADWGKVILFHVGASGIAQILDVLNLATDGGASTVTGTLVAGPIAISAGGGEKGNIGGAGGIATGGAVNTNGFDRAGGNGGVSGAGAIENENPGGGGHEQVDGGIGSVTFEWDFVCGSGGSGS